jgi:hypothetical protein
MEEVFTIYPILRTAAEQGVSVLLERIGGGLGRLCVQGVYPGTSEQVKAVAQAVLETKGAV